MRTGEAAEPVSFRLLSPEELAKRLASDPPPVVLDVRRRAAFLERPWGIPGAVPVVLDDEPIRVPDVARDRAIAVYCLCRGEASSSRVARGLAAIGYRDLAVLEGGLGAWSERNLPLAELLLDDAHHKAGWTDLPLGAVGGDLGQAAAHLDEAFVPRLVAQALVSRRDLPMRRAMTVLFVDMADSTRLFTVLPAEEVLALVQAFMEVVVEVGVIHCGDVHDFEGDGALLYFEGVGEAVPAAFELRERLLERRRVVARLPLPRISLDEGPVVIGVVGGRFRRSLALVGPSIPRAARILKLVPPGAIVVTETVYGHAVESSPDLAARFTLHEVAPPLKGFEDEGGPSLRIAPPVDA